MKQWILRKDVPDETLKEFSELPGLVGHLLFYRGIKTKKEAEIFLKPNYEEDLDDPFKIFNMDKAVERILKAIRKNQRIVVFGDYDADGVCATAILHDFFKKIDFDNFHIYIPDRNLGGYGLTLESIDEFVKDKTDLIITLDCGITDYDEVEKANKSGIDVVITDHHLAPVCPTSGREKLPNAYAVLDSKQEKDKYPFKHLSGAGVAFKLIQALVKKGVENELFNIVPGWEKWLLDLVVISSVADMVPLVDENRVLSIYGLRVLGKTKRTGLLALCRRLDFSPENVKEDDIGFMIAPRINITSRMEHANASFNLLITESTGEANWISGRMEMLISERKRIVGEILNEVDVFLSKKKKIPEVIVIGNKEWGAGILGLTAARLVEKYKQPVFLWGKGGAKEIKGSCRSNGTINIVELMREVSKDFFIDIGGHAMAAGFSLKEEKVDDLEKNLLNAFKKTAKSKVDCEVLEIDKELSLDDINEDFYALISQFEPFGVENPRPVFSFIGLEVANVKKFGNGGIHLQLEFKKSNGEKTSAIGFFFENNGFNIKKGDYIDLAATIEKSFYRATPEIRLRIIDLKPIK